MPGEPLVEASSACFFVQRESVKSVSRPPHQFNAIDEQSALKVEFWLLKNEPFERAAFHRSA